MPKVSSPPIDLRRLEDERLDPRTRAAIAAYDERGADYQQAYRRRRSRLDVHRFAAMAADDALVLDAGCGPASDTRLLRDANLHPVGVDLSMGALRTARMLLPRDPFVQAPYDDLPFASRTFGGLWLSGSLDHLPRNQWSTTLDTFFRLLDRGPVYFSCVRGEADLRPFEHPVLGTVAVSAANEEQVEKLLASRGVVDLTVEVRPEPLMAKKVPLVVAIGRVL